MMPAARIDGGPWQLESADILRQVGYGAVSKQDMSAIYNAWLGVTHRSRSARRFFYAASLSRDPHPSSVHRLGKLFLLSFTVLYFYLLLKYMIRAGVQPDPENFADQFLYWELRLKGSAYPYLGGHEPDILDMLLFGIIQCHCSIPVPPVEALQRDPRLSGMRSWIATMQARFSDFEHLYSGIYFEPHSPAPVRATRIEQAAFWFGLVFMVVLFPITLPLIVFLAIRVPRD